MSFTRFFLFSLALLGNVASAQYDPGAEGSFLSALAEPAPAVRIGASLQANVDGYKAGEAFLLALNAKFESPWHAYFRNPGTVGEPISTTLEAPEGFLVEGPYWEVPHRLKGAVGFAYGYESPVFVWKITPGQEAPAEARFKASITAQLCCDEGCAEPETASATLELASGTGAASPKWEHEEKRSEVLGNSPLPVSAEQTHNTVILKFPADQNIKTAYFFSEDNAIAPQKDQPLKKTDEGYELTLPRNDHSDAMYPVADESLEGRPLERLRGILAYDDRHCSVDISPVPMAAETEHASRQSTMPMEKAGVPAGFLGIVGGLFMGGLILNLMPCVFPVIGLKVMSFVHLGGGSRRKVFLHSMAFVAGILFSFWALSALLLAITADGERNWAVWMQNAWVVYGILLLLIALGLSMFGIFEIGVGVTGAGQTLQNKSGLWGSFFQGLLVTIVATPCSAPFLGAAMPAAMALPGGWLVAALTFMALGLAFPYIVLGIFPSLVRFLPRPGAWMESLKQGLSFLLFAAAAWMLDVYMAFWPESEKENTMWMLMSLVLICAAFWVYGRWCPLYRSLKCRIAAGAIVLALLSLGVYGSMPRSAPEEEPTALAQPQWEPWSQESMNSALDKGFPVYVDFTAKWCATCQANKKTAYSKEVYDLFARSKVVLLRADKTRPRADVDAEMRKLHRSSVPVNALYLPGKDPIVTRELLTADYLADFLRKNLTSHTEQSKDETPDASAAAHSAEQ